MIHQDQIVMKDKRVYEEGLAFLIQMFPLDAQLLERYFTPNYTDRLTRNEIYERMLLSSTNVGRNITTIKKHLGHEWGTGEQKVRWSDLKSKLYDFDPVQIIAAYGTDSSNWDQILRDVQPELSPIPQTVARFFKTVISAANFMSQFESATDFYQWVGFFDNDKRAKATLPMLIAYEVDGFGFTLACDFIKELGYPDFPKPDGHLKDIFKALQLCDAKADDYWVYKAIIRAAKNAGVTAYKLDKILYLIGSGDFYHHDRTITGRKPEFIRHLKARLETEGLL